MLLQCPQNACRSSSANPASGRLVRNGFFYRKSDSTRVRRFRCLICKRSTSVATTNSCYRQKKRQVNEPLRRLLVSGVSQRRSARILRVTRKTVERKFRFLAEQARVDQCQFRESFLQRSPPLSSIQFDELETVERSKCLPLSVALAVSHPARKILGFRVSSMPAKGHLAKISVQKYGFRADHRARGLRELFTEISPLLHPRAEILSDQCPRYPLVVAELLPEARHATVLSRRGCVAGQGELKKIGFDPLFSLNHTCAMLRANINRLFRRTWCTSKRADRLADHIALYVQAHNRELTTEG